MFILDTMLKRLIKKGALTIIDADGKSHSYGQGGGYASTIRITDKATAWKLLTNPELEFGEAFMDGRVVLEKGDVYDMVALIMQNIGWSTHIGPLSRVASAGRKLGRRLAQYNPAGKSKHNVAHHYDLKDELFDLFLDSDRQYSCAYFPTPDITLEEAQAYKKRHIAAKLLLEPGVTVLDIGSGWGGLGLYIANVTKANVTGITLSEEQHRVSNARAQAAGIADRVRFELVDYRQESRRYDRIVSVGMFEHVGVNHFDAYFRKIAEMLTEKGVAVIHAIGRSDGPGATNPWIQKYIFPGGYSPALSEVLPAVERAGLIVTDVEILRLHYAETLKHWRERFNLRRDQIRALYDDRFCRMWELYLASSEATFRWGGHMNFQIQVAKSLGTVPLTRDYIGEAERKLPLDLEPIPAPSRQAAE